jgi:Leucine-rich repeat (LRR) protein
LYSLFLDGTQVTGTGFTNLTALNQLIDLQLQGSPVSDEGLKSLADSLANLETLNLNNTGITDAGLQHLPKLTKLRTLSLRETKISDRGMSHLAELSQLGSLDIAKTEISNEGLLRLKGLKQLSFISAEKSGIDKAGAEELQAALPNVSVYH